ncbi:MAG: VWA domain-containing protein [Verrucomicrobiia bacterium]|jgi:Flp pilus assembly protein TadG
MRKIAHRFRQREQGQTLLMFVLMLVVMIGFVGLGVDLGFAYISRARLSKAVDSACLNGMRNFWQGTTNASMIASNTFAMNYGTCGRDVAPPTVTINFSKDSNNNTVLNVQATVAINTFFIGVMPAIGGISWKTLTVGESAQSTRTKVILALVLDRSGSMDPITGTTKGGAALPGAVSTFVSFFSDTIDEASMASFASTATQDIPMEQPFIADISTAADNLNWGGGTYSVGGLADAFAQENSVIVPANEVALKVVVFFTDGRANMIQQQLSCGQIFNFGGYDISGSGAAFFPTNTSLRAQGTAECTAPEDGSMGSGCGCNVSTYTSPQNGNPEKFETDGIIADSQYECEQLALQMQNQNILVYSIGLGGDKNDPVNSAFLAQVANATNSATYNPKLPTGLALVASDPSQLQPYFTQIANDILFRLTQ